ncbi:unnamed protein product, partial [Discosporangium mesarthrocarpum]
MSVSNLLKCRKVYVPHPQAAWARASVLRSLGGKRFEVRIEGVDDMDEPSEGDRGAGDILQLDLEGETPGLQRIISLQSGTSLPLQNTGVPEDGVPDMTKLNYLHEPAILFNVRRRFFRALPYTYTGEIVIACNPYRWLDLYGPELGQQYALLGPGERSSMPPHVFSTSALAYSMLWRKRINQSILVSGESGAGKTETVKILMGHLATLASEGRGGGLGVREKGKDGSSGAGEGGSGSMIIEKIIESNPLLESFGNAKTTRNDNSSRFGKFTQLQFDPRFRMVGSSCTTYLLEKSRVVGHEVGERAYHIFYQASGKPANIILAAPDKDKVPLDLVRRAASDFQYLTADGREAESVIEGKTDGQRFLMTKAALQVIGVSPEDMRQLFRALAGVLYLGQV